ncbi:hypothetical protein LCGC14_3062390, partial [marine sediment metagenome]
FDNASVGSWEEFQAGNAIAALKARLALKAKAKRGGQWTSIAARELVPDDLIRVRLGDIVPADALRSCASRVLAEDPVGALSYGAGSGYGPLREWIASRYGVEPERVLVTNGSLQAATMLFDLLIGPGDPVVVESPSYDRTLLALRERDAKLVAVPLKDDGVDVGALEIALEAGARPSLAHLIPNFHNPTGATLSLERRRAVLEIARRHRLLIIEDDAYCVDILTQISAVTTALDRVGLKLLEGHVQGCVREAMVKGGAEGRMKTEELLEAVERFARMR